MIKPREIIPVTVGNSQAGIGKRCGFIIAGRNKSNDISLALIRKDSRGARVAARAFFIFHETSRFTFPLTIRVKTPRYFLSGVRLCFRVRFNMRRNYRQNTLRPLRNRSAPRVHVHAGPPAKFFIFKDFTIRYC